MMITIETLQACEKDDLPAIVPTLEAVDLRQLVDWLNEKDDNLRYKSFLLLEGRSDQYPDVYPYWETFVEKFGSANSYQRSLGLMLVAANARWDEDGRLEAILDRYLALCDDEKPVTVRQCIQGLCKIVPYKPLLHARIADRLISIDLAQRKETQRKILLMDILSVLALIRKACPDGRIDRYILDAMTGGILDSKAKRTIEALL
jgi:hypothetical protein